MIRDNTDWVSHLRADGPAREAAVRDLREALLARLRKALADRAPDDAFIEDAVQDSLLRILDRLDQFQGRSRFLTWATAIAIRVAMSELRRSRWKDVSLDALLADAGFPRQRAIDTKDEATAERGELFALMLRIIDTELTGRQRAALLAELKGMPQIEIARHLGSNRNAVYKLAHDARKKLKQGLESAGYNAVDIRAAIAT